MVLKNFMVPIGMSDSYFQCDFIFRLNLFVLIERTSCNCLLLSNTFVLHFSYLINLVHYMLLKTQGRPIENTPTIDRMVELRTVRNSIEIAVESVLY